MLTHDQTTIRLRDAEISRLRKENERLTNKLNEVKTQLVKLVRFVAKDMPYQYRSQALALADELEADSISSRPLLNLPEKYDENKL